MKRTMKSIFAATAVLFGATLFPVGAFAADDLLQQIKARGMMRVCDLPYPPWNIKNPITNEWEGINVDLINEIAKMLNVKVEHVDTDWATVLQSVNTGKCDFTIATLWITSARAQIATFTAPIAEEGMTLFVKVDSTAKTLEDIDQPGKIVTAPTGTPNEKWNQANFKKATAKSIVGDKMASALMEVAAGRADAANGRRCRRTRSRRLPRRGSRRSPRQRRAASCGSGKHALLNPFSFRVYLPLRASRHNGRRTHLPREARHLGAANLAKQPARSAAGQRAAARERWKGPHRDRAANPPETP